MNPNAYKWKLIYFPSVEYFCFSWIFFPLFFFRNNHSMLSVSNFRIYGHDKIWSDFPLVFSFFLINSLLNKIFLFTLLSFLFFSLCFILSLHLSSLLYLDCSDSDNYIHFFSSSRFSKVIFLFSIIYAKINWKCE